ncbi:MAG: helix-turn-helix domain-containing protein [Boseongicola sp. SB0662_bin_57]|nr:helix-turn-helix domain-containing protein [Boseongicola sp. SB0662_bin_57]
MNMMAHRQLPPSAKEAAIARASGQLLSRYARNKASLKLRVTDGVQAEPIELPAGAVALLMDILEAMAAGQGVTIIPENAELTTVQAADVLNVSRPFLIKLLDEQKIPHRKVGKHRRIRMEDVMAYKASIDAERESVLDQLAADAQEQDMGYGKP